jgi:hypothetical protein
LRSNLGAERHSRCGFTMSIGAGYVLSREISRDAPHIGEIGQGKVARKALPAPQADLPIGEPAEQDATGHPDGHEPAVLLATKLHVPHISDRLVTRSALVNALEQGVSGKLTLLIAPAGWGKTTLLAQWVAGHASAATRGSGCAGMPSIATRR